MNKVRYKVTSILIIILCITIFSSCGQSESINAKGSFTDIENSIIEKVKENYEDGDISLADISVEEIHCGSFSKKDTKEIFAICNILNAPHVAGLDKSVCILLTVDSLECKAYKEFASDETVINCMQTGNGIKRILVSETSTYQGISSQDIRLFAIQDNHWIDMPIDALSDFGEECFYFMTDDTIIVASKNNLTDPSDIMAVLKWNPDVEQFSFK